MAEAVAMLTTEVAELTGKRHADVMRDTRNMLSQLQTDERRFALVYRDAKGEGRPCFLLPNRELMILVTGNRVDLRAALKDRVEQHEAERRNTNVGALPSRVPMFGSLRAAA